MPIGMWKICKVEWDVEIGENVKRGKRNLNNWNGGGNRNA